MNNELIRATSLPLYKARFWIKLLGGLTFIYGLLMAISIVGLLVAWVPVWMGVLLWQSTNALEQAHLAGDAEQFIHAQKKLATWFTITGVLLLLNLLVIVGVFFLAISAGVMQQMNLW